MAEEAIKNTHIEYNGDPNSLPKELFTRSRDADEALHDQAFETKPVSYLKGAFMRFSKNKASIVAGIILLILALYAIIVPFVSPRSYVSSITYPNGFMDAEFDFALPYNSWFKGTGFWDGTSERTLSRAQYEIYSYDDSNHSPIVGEAEATTVPGVGTYYTARVDSYAVGCKERTLTTAAYQALVQYEEEQGIAGTENSIMKPVLDVESYLTEYAQTMRDFGVVESNITLNIDAMRNYYNQNQNCYYKLTQLNRSGTRYEQNSVRIAFNEDNEVEDIYLRDENGDLCYYETTQNGYRVRVDYFDYSTYVNGFEPYYLFGSNGRGQDIFLRLALGARFSLLLGIGISAINFLIGLIWGSISGYYGGTADLVMERVTDIISAIPSVIILTVCSIQFTNNTSLRMALGSSGVMILAFLVAFVYSGWIGVASTTRMQFYRYKGQEYVLASRTLGAKDSRLIFKHILPNAVGTLVTSSVLMIPSVIFSESSLSYLGIIDFTSSGIASIGSLLEEGQGYLSDYPHVLLFPCVVISLLMICFNLFGNGLRDAFNTTLRGSEN